MKDTERETFDRRLNKLLRVGDHLPEGWDIRLNLSEVEVDLGLEGPDGENVEFNRDDCDFAGLLFSAVDEARERENLPPVRWTEILPGFAEDYEDWGKDGDD